MKMYGWVSVHEETRLRVELWAKDAQPPGSHPGTDRPAVLLTTSGGVFDEPAELQDAARRARQSLELLGIPLRDPLRPDEEPAIDYGRLDELAAAGVDVGVTYAADPGLVCPGEGGHAEHEWEQTGATARGALYSCRRVGCGATLSDEAAVQTEPVRTRRDYQGLDRELAADELLVVRAARGEDGRLVVALVHHAPDELAEVGVLGRTFEPTEQGARAALGALARTLGRSAAFPRLDGEFGLDQLQPRLEAIARVGEASP